MCIRSNKETSGMQSLVIGSSSQLAHYFPQNVKKISSRDYDINALTGKTWGTVYICFAEQRTYLANAPDQSIANLFWSVNVTMTLDLIHALQPKCEKIIYFSTAELWNRTTGPVDADQLFSYYSNLYTDSKAAISQKMRDKKEYPKVSIIYPFNFNSIHRSDQYLFGKIFRSIIHEEPITIGDVDYYRELMHPAMIVQGSMRIYEAGRDVIIGSGRLVHVGDFIRRLYAFFGLDFNGLVRQEVTAPSIYRHNIFYSATFIESFSVEHLFRMTIEELQHEKEKIRE